MTIFTQSEVDALLYPEAAAQPYSPQADEDAAQMTAPAQWAAQHPAAARRTGRVSLRQVALVLCLGFGTLGAAVFGWAYFTGTHGTLSGLEALGSLGLIALGWEGADRLARRTRGGR